METLGTTATQTHPTKQLKQESWLLQRPLCKKLTIVREFSTEPPRISSKSFKSKDPRPNGRRQRGLVGSICHADFSLLLKVALQVLDSKCKAFGNSGRIQRFPMPSFAISDFCEISASIAPVLPVWPQEISAPTRKPRRDWVQSDILRPLNRGAVVKRVLKGNHPERKSWQSICASASWRLSKKPSVPSSTTSPSWTWHGKCNFLARPCASPPRRYKHPR